MYRVTAIALIGLVSAHAEDAAPPPLVAGVDAVRAADNLSEAELKPVIERLATVVCPSDNVTLATGIRELAKRETRFVIATGEGYDGRHLTAGVAHFQLGSIRLDARAKALNQGIASKRFPTAPTSVTWQLASQDLDDGRYVTSDEVSGPVATLQINAVNASNPRWRRFGPPIPNGAWPGGPVTQAGGGVGQSANTNYPLTVPEVDYTKVQTTVAVPMGIDAIAAWDAQLAAMNQHANNRDPDVAWNFYRTSLEQLEHVYPKATVVWTTLPLSSSRNTLRNYFNYQVRAYATANHKPLLDIAAIQSVNADGQPVVDAEGEASAPQWVTAGSQPRLNADGAVRIAKAWWWMQTKLTPK